MMYAKNCTICNSEIQTDNWNAFIRLKYCEKCRRKAYQDKNTSYVKRLRSAEKRLRNLKEEELKIAHEKNNLLQNQVDVLREMVIRTQSELDKIKQESRSKT